MIQGQVYIGQGLGLDALRRVHHQYGAVAGCQGAADLIVEVHMAGGVYQVQDILLPVTGLVHGADGLGLDGDAPLPLQIHIVQHLGLHLPAGQQACVLDDAVGQGGFAVVYVRYDAEISDSALFGFSVHGFH